MRIIIDGLPEQIDNEATVSDVLQQRDEPTEHIIVEINGSFVHPSSYARRRLREGDRMEIVYPAFGG